jgi:hypothetical protein
VKRKLAGMKLGADGARQGAEERSSLLSKLLFSRYSGNHCGRIEEESGSSLSPFTSGKPNSATSETQSVSIPIKIMDSPPYDMNGISNPTSISASTNEARSQYFSSLSSPSYTPAPLSATTNKRPASLIFSSGVSKPPRSPMLSSYSTSQSTSSTQNSPYSVDSFPSQKPPIMLQITPTPSIFTNQSTTNIHVVEIQSSDVEGGLKDLLNKVTEVYGGEGKVKMKKSKKKDNSYSFKYIGPEKAALLLEKALKTVKELQKKNSPWKFTQRLEISVI